MWSVIDQWFNNMMEFSLSPRSDYVWPVRVLDCHPSGSYSQCVKLMCALYAWYWIGSGSPTLLSIDHDKMCVIHLFDFIAVYLTCGDEVENAFFRCVRCCSILFSWKQQSHAYKLSNMQTSLDILSIHLGTHPLLIPSRDSRAYCCSPRKAEQLLIPYMYS